MDANGLTAGHSKREWLAAIACYLLVWIALPAMIWGASWV